MLRYLQIRNFAVIAELELEFREGMTVFTGETGAGKSILVEALGLLMGDRFDSHMLRAGCEQAQINAVFACPPDAAIQTLLGGQGIDVEDELILKRQFGADGRTRAFINGSPATNQNLRALGEHLADIHGQHEHHSLLRRDTQRDLLDLYANHGALVQAVAETHTRIRSLQAELEALPGNQADVEKETEVLRYQLDELAAANPTADGIVRLEAAHRRAVNVGRLAESGQAALATLAEDDNSLESSLQRVASELQSLSRLDPRLAETQELLSTAGIQLQEAAHGLRAYLDSLEGDPAEIERLEQQMALLHELARKHHLRVEQLPEQLEVLRARLTAVEASAGRRAELMDLITAALAAYHRAAETLHASRSEAAKRLAKAVIGNMRKLGMGGGIFEIGVDMQSNNEPGPHGNDRIEFRVSTNAGQPPKPLTKVASGGELSRISLAIQVITAAGKTIPTLVFDEVDVGIGGRTAEIVGRMLRALGEKRQVLCVTHLPQVAALGHDHMRVAKSARKGETWVEVARLDDEAKVAEIARMLGGITIGPETVEHARAMLAQAG